MEHCRSPDGVISVSVRPYYTMLSRVYLALAMGFLVKNMGHRFVFRLTNPSTHLKPNTDR